MVVSDDPLESLPEGHAYRNTPLASLGAVYRPVGSSVWRRVLPTYGIAGCTFNQLGEPWRRWDEWRVEVPTPP